MKIDYKVLFQLFRSTFSLSAFTFGGGYVIVPLMQKKFVAIAQSSPGAIAINASIIIGYRIQGVVGAIVSVFGTVLPPFLVISIITLCYDWFIQVEAIQTILFGMQAGVCAVICDVVYKMAKDIVSQGEAIYIVLMLVAFLLSVVFNVHLLLIILGCGIAGYIFEKKRGEVK